MLMLLLLNEHAGREGGRFRVICTRVPGGCNKVSVVVLNCVLFVFSGEKLSKDFCIFDGSQKSTMLASDMK